MAGRHHHPESRSSRSLVSSLEIFQAAIETRKSELLLLPKSREHLWNLLQSERDAGRDFALYDLLKSFHQLASTKVEAQN